MHIGVIADDLTGATDIAGFIAGGGLQTDQILGLPRPGSTATADAAVVSLKTRSLPPEEAVAQSLDALDWLLANGAKQIYFKYCSTFDSTEKGNIGPVTDALLGKMGEKFTIVCPSLPVNGRTVKNGVLLIDGVPLSETGMRHHPVNPMTDSDLTRLMNKQSRGKTGLVDIGTVRNGGMAVQSAMARLRKSGFSYAVMDAETDADLDIIAESIVSMRLLTGGSGLGGSLSRLIAAREKKMPDPLRPSGKPKAGKAIALSGSCSEMTNKQVAEYKERVPSIQVNVGRCLQDPAYPDYLTDWAELHASGPLAPLIYATVGKEELAAIQKKYGVTPAAAAIESLFAKVTALLRKRQFSIFIVAGGETSGSVAEALGGGTFHLGPEIAPGVPWIRSTAGDLSLALKSGNFGDVRFFSKAQEFVD